MPHGKTSEQVAQPYLEQTDHELLHPKFVGINSAVGVSVPALETCTQGQVLRSHRQQQHGHNKMDPSARGASGARTVASGSLERMALQKSSNVKRPASDGLRGNATSPSRRAVLRCIAVPPREADSNLFRLPSLPTQIVHQVHMHYFLHCHIQFTPTWAAECTPSRVVSCVCVCVSPTKRRIPVGCVAWCEFGCGARGGRDRLSHGRCSFPQSGAAR